MTHRNDETAIIGMACRVPGANGPDAFWRMLVDGQDASQSIAPHKAVAAGTQEEALNSPGFVLRHHPVDDSYQGVDTSLFGLTAREATVMDPQHRMFSEVLWEALEDAGRTGEGESVGVFASTGTNTYLHLLMAEEGHQTPADDSVLWLLNDSDFLSTRLSYAMDLRGPSMSVQTACSGSLVALHMACQALENGDCEIAVVGGTALELLSQRGYQHRSGGIGSVDGRCRPFCADATGSARGSGAAAVVLKPLSAAIRDGDDVIATIRGSAVNNDGRDKAGFTAPSVEGQAEVIRLAQRRAGIGPQDVDYVEAHGTGTSLGDPLEIRALESVFGARTGDACRLGSLKANIGHLDAAAGIIGVIKAALIARYRKFPPQVNFSAPCSALAGSGTLAVNTNEEHVIRDGRVNVGVTSLGFGGTNAHVIVSEAAPVEDSLRVPEPEGAWHVLPVSAATEWSLLEQCRTLAEFIGSGEHSVIEVARTLRFGRRTLPHRAAVVARTAKEAAQAMADVARGGQRAPEEVLQTVGNAASERTAAEMSACRWVSDPGHRLPGERGRYPLLRLPTYTFDRKRHWPLRVAAPSPKSDGTRVHKVRWSPSDESAGAVPPGSSVLLIDEPGERAETVAALLSERFDQVRILAPEEAERKPSSLTAPTLKIVIDLSGLGPRSSATDGYTRFRRIIEFVSHTGATRVLCMAAGALALPSDETADRSPALSTGALNAFNAEHEDATATLLDVPPGLDYENLALLCLEELGHSDPRVAWREGRRWLPEYPEAPIAVSSPSRGALRWLITGGKGGIATALTDRILATRPHDTVVLAARGARPQPVRGYEAVELSEESPDDSPLRWLEADVCDGEAMERVSRLCEQALGGVDVVLHTAGHAGGGRLGDGGVHDTAYVLSPKVEGTNNVVRLFSGKARVVLFSSLTTVKPLAGAADYAAANVYLEDVATRHQTEGDWGVLAIAWPTWRDTGMARGFSHGLTPDTGLRMIIDRLEESGVLFVATPQEPMPSRKQDVVRPEHGDGPPADPRSIIRKLWHQVLGGGEFNDEENLIDLGADSFVMLRFLDLADERLGPVLSLDDLFEYPNLAEQSALVESRRANGVTQ